MPPISASSPSRLSSGFVYASSGFVYADPEAGTQEAAGGSTPHAAPPLSSSFDEVAEVTVQGRGSKGKGRRAARSKLGDLAVRREQ